MALEHDWKRYPELTNVEMQTMELMSPHKQIKEDFWATVIKVYDGDTVTLEIPERDFGFKLRFLNINAPEMNEGGERTRDWLRDKILGELVFIKIDPFNRVGKYGRLLGRIIFRGMDLGEEELQLGLAKPFGQEREGEPEKAEKVFSMKQWF